MNGTKRTTGYAIMILALAAPMVGYELADVAPAEIARFSDSTFVIIGLIVALYGEYKAKAPLWFAQKK